jgi:hypothetical protein
VPTRKTDCAVFPFQQKAIVIMRAIAGDYTQISLTESCCEIGFSSAERHMSEGGNRLGVERQMRPKALRATKFVPPNQTAGGDSRSDTELKGDRLDFDGGSLGARSFAWDR